MAGREKFGKFVLLEETATCGLGTEYRAAKLGQAGLEKIVSVLQLSPGLSSDAEMARSLMDQIKVAAQLHSPNVVRIYGIGRVESSYYISYEFIEGKSMHAIMERCVRDGFPFSVDHTLLIASKICSALEYAHGRKTESGARYFHALLNTADVLVSYEGEVRVTGFGYGHSRIREAGVLRDDETLYLAPEQVAGAAGDTRSDIFAVGAILYESLTGEPLFKGGRSEDPAARIAAARLQSPTGDDDSVPKPIADILSRSLASEPARRYAEIQEMRKAVDTLLFSGDFTPTTFNLAFFMHSLFREDIERESKQLKDEREASYLEFFADDLARAGAKNTAATVALPTPLAADPAPPATTSATVPAVAAPPPVALAPPHEAVAASHETLPPPPPLVTSSEAPAKMSASDAASGFTFHKDEPAKSKAPLMAVAALLLALAGVAAFYVLGGRTSSTPPGPMPTTLSPAGVAAMAKVKELEEKLQTFEAEKAAAEAKAAEEAKKKLESQARTRGQEADPAAVAKAQEEAATRARAEQEKKQEEERRKLEEAKAAEEARLAEEQRLAEEARVAALAVTTTTTLATPPPTTLPALQPGALVDVSDPGVLAPVADKTPPLQYPQIALRQRVEGTVELNVLVDEKGLVTDAQVVRGAGGKAGLDEAAIDNVKKRRYRPATKDGVPVKVWIPVRVQFRLPS